MKISVVAGNPLAQQSGILFVFVTQQAADKSFTQTATLKKLDHQLKGLLFEQLDKEKFKGGADDAKILFTRGLAPYDYIAIVGLGDKKKVDVEKLRRAAARLPALANANHAGKVTVDVDEAHVGRFSVSELAQAVVEGLRLSSYQFSRYKKAKETFLKEVVFITAKTAHVANLEKGVIRAELLSEAVCLARDLVNGSGADITPKVLADTALKCQGVKVKVHDLSAIKKMKMGAFLSVAKGSTVNPPYFIEMHYTPKGHAKKKVAIVGKGVTFDSGGYSLKPAKSMETMKDDMSGAATVISLMSVISRLKPDIQVSGYVAATENMIDGGAQRPGDVCTAMNGTTIEVLNTDAEGRLTLADALHYANQNNPDYLIDMATLTGACLVSLGMLYSGIMGNDQKLINGLIAAGKYAGENIWHLPLPEEYKSQIKSDIADLKNIGGQYGGTLTAGLFLQDFVGKTKWAHLDIAGPAFAESTSAYTQKGGTGVMIRTLSKFLDEL